MVLVQREGPGNLIDGQRSSGDVVRVCGKVSKVLAEGVAGGLERVDLLAVCFGAREARLGVAPKAPRKVVGAVPELRIVPAGLGQTVEAVDLAPRPVHTVPVPLRELLDGRVASHEERGPGGLRETRAPKRRAGKRMSLATSKGIKLQKQLNHRHGCI